MLTFIINVIEMTQKNPHVIVPLRWEYHNGVKTILRNQIEQYSNMTVLWHSLRENWTVYIKTT